MMSNDSGATPLEGKMFLYEQPELLNHEHHGNLGLVKVDKPFGFVRDVKALPLTVSEFASAQKSYPIVFSDNKNPVPLAVMSVFEGKNLFVSDDGEWASLNYIPAYVRCYPFAFATRPDDQYAVVIDRAATSISDNPDQPFFEGDKLTPGTDKFIEFCGQYDAERKRTREICERIRDLDLLTGQQATQTDADGKEQVIASYIAIDASKLSDLDKDLVHELHQNGTMSFIMAHLFSLENWQRLVARQTAL